jgi:hypothetical protein
MPFAFLTGNSPCRGSHVGNPAPLQPPCLWIRTVWNDLRDRRGDRPVFRFWRRVISFCTGSNLLFGVGSDARSASKSAPNPRTATHCTDEFIGARLGSRLEADCGSNRKPIHKPASLSPRKTRLRLPAVRPGKSKHTTTLSWSDRFMMRSFPPRCVTIGATNAPCSGVNSRANVNASEAL